MGIKEIRDGRRNENRWKGKVEWSSDERKGSVRRGREEDRRTGAGEEEGSRRRGEEEGSRRRGEDLDEKKKGVGEEEERIRGGQEKRRR